MIIINVKNIFSGFFDEQNVWKNRICLRIEVMCNILNVFTVTFFFNLMHPCWINVLISLKNIYKDI